MYGCVWVRMEQYVSIGFVTCSLTVKLMEAFKIASGVLASLNKSNGSCLGRREVRHVGIANSNDNISCYDGPMKMVDGSLES